MVYETPHLTTAMTGPLYLLEQKLLDNQQAIERWFEQEWKKTPAPIYGSVDLRNAGFKLAPVDMNLFPAGFNNLNKDFYSLSVEAARVAVLQAAPEAKRILIVPESHTRNLFYLENVHTLATILTTAGFEIRLATLLAETGEPLTVDLPSGATLLLEPIQRDANRISVQDFMPDVILLNNDLSDGIPPSLKNLTQPVLPPAELGWSQRLKSGHFQHYAAVSDEFAKFIDIDPWFIAPLFRHCGKVNFMEHEGEDCLVRYAEQLFADIEKKYQENAIQCRPFLILKADAGTYGMAVMTIYQPSELKNLNRKQRTKMSTIKGGKSVSQVILQEGVYTFETWGTDEAVAEPVVYLWGQRVVGGFYRVHKGRGVDENLNSPGMHFEPLAFAKTCHEPTHDLHPDECQNRFYAYSVIARLSMLSAAREIATREKI